MANGTTYQKTKTKSGKINPKVKNISKKKYDRLSKRYSKKGDTASTTEVKKTKPGFAQKVTRDYTFKSKTNKKGTTKTKVVSKTTKGSEAPILYRESIPLGKTPKIPTR